MCIYNVYWSLDLYFKNWRIIGGKPTNRDGAKSLRGLNENGVPLPFISMYISDGIVLSQIKWDFIRKHKPKITTLKRNKIFKMYLFLLIYWCIFNIILWLLTNHAFRMIFNVIYIFTIHLLIIMQAHFSYIFSMSMAAFFRGILIQFYSHL